MNPVQFKDVLTEQKRIQEEMAKNRIPTPPGYHSNQVIINRNRGVTPMFINDHGGCSDNYR